jgi:tripartite-type tricarboxylate transporter receptor subunit TctC
MRSQNRQPTDRRFWSPSHTINATLYPKLPYDPITDFTPISMIATVPSLLVSHPKLQAQDLASRAPRPPE